MLTGSTGITWILELLELAKLLLYVWLFHRCNEPAPHELIMVKSLPQCTWSGFLWPQRYLRNAILRYLCAGSNLESSFIQGVGRISLFTSARNDIYTRFAWVINLESDPLLAHGFLYDETNHKSFNEHEPDWAPAMDNILRIAFTPRRRVQFHLLFCCFVVDNQFSVVLWIVKWHVKYDRKHLPVPFRPDGRMRASYLPWPRIWSSTFFSFSRKLILALLALRVGAVIVLLIVVLMNMWMITYSDALHMQAR